MTKFNNYTSLPIFSLSFQFEMEIWMFFHIFHNRSNTYGNGIATDVNVVDTEDNRLNIDGEEWLWHWN